MLDDVKANSVQLSSRWGAKKAGNKILLAVDLFFGFFRCITLHKMNIYFDYNNSEIETVIKINTKLHSKAGSF